MQMIRAKWKNRTWVGTHIIGVCYDMHFIIFKCTFASQTWCFPSLLRLHVLFHRMYVICWSTHLLLNLKDSYFPQILHACADIGHISSHLKKLTHPTPGGFRGLPIQCASVRPWSVTRSVLSLASLHYPCGVATIRRIAVGASRRNNWAHCNTWGVATVR